MLGNKKLNKTKMVSWFPSLSKPAFLTENHEILMEWRGGMRERMKEKVPVCVCNDSAFLPADVYAEERERVRTSVH